jgi:hypothetical protein
MLIHVVCWKYRPDVDEAAKAEHRRRLKTLPGLVQGIERFDVGADVLRLDRSYDTGLVAEFADLEALEAYNIHPEHQNVVAVGRQIAETVMSVDFYREA